MVAMVGMVVMFFVVVTFNEVGDLLPPEICEVRNDKAYFRGGEVL